MSSVLSNLSGSIGGVVGGTEHWVAEQWTQRVVQVSVYASIVFFVLSSYPLIAFVEKHVWNVFGVKLGKEGTLALHSVIFGLFMYVGTRFILDPMVGKVVEGGGGSPTAAQPDNTGNCVTLFGKTTCGAPPTPTADVPPPVTTSWMKGSNRECSLPGESGYDRNECNKHTPGEMCKLVDLPEGGQGGRCHNYCSTVTESTQVDSKECPHWHYCKGCNDEISCANQREGRPQDNPYECVAKGPGDYFYSH